MKHQRPPIVVPPQVSKALFDVADGCFDAVQDGRITEWSMTNWRFDRQTEVLHIDLAYRVPLKPDLIEISFTV